MNQKEQIEEIKLKKRQEQYRRKIFVHRIIVSAVCIILFLIIVCILKGCVSSVLKRNEQLKQEQATIVTPEPTVQPEQSPTEISAAYYAESAFVGNSFIDDMMTYDIVEGADYFAKIGLNVNAAMTKSSDADKSVIDELNNGKRYRKIFIMFGINELGWSNTEIFVKQFGELIDKVREYQPDGKVYLLSIAPVTKAVSDKNNESVNNARILEYNEMIKQLAKDKNAIYADIHTAIAGSDGTLPDDAASDGIHFGKEYYKKMLLYIQNNLTD